MIPRSRWSQLNTRTTPDAARALIETWRGGQGSAIADIWNKMRIERESGGTVQFKLGDSYLDFGDYRYRVAPDPVREEQVAMAVARRHV